MGGEAEVGDAAAGGPRATLRGFHRWPLFVLASVLACRHPFINPPVFKEPVGLVLGGRRGPPGKGKVVRRVPPECREGVSDHPTPPPWQAHQKEQKMPFSLPF